MMLRSFVTAMVVSLAAHAGPGTVQVPEGCINRVTPCLVRTEHAPFVFMQNNVQVRMGADSLLKITGSASQVDFEIMAGYAALTEITDSKIVYSLNNVAVDSSKIMGARDAGNLRILSLVNFSYSQYKISEEKYPVRLSSQFINKKDLVFFTRHFYTDANEYRVFLSGAQKTWSSEFKRQNISQTKALMRSIASQQQQEKELSEKLQKQQRELKRVRENFFYRTFHR